MSADGLLPGPDPLRTRRLKRIADRVGRNDRLPTEAWRYLVPAADTLVGTGPWPIGVSDGNGVVHGHLDRLADSVIPLATATDGRDRADIGLLTEPTPDELVAAAARLADGRRLVIELHPSRRHTVGDVRARLAAARLVVDEVYTISPNGDGWQPTLWLPTSRPGPVLELLRTGAAWPGRGRTRRLARTVGTRAARWAALIGERPWLLFPTRPWVLLAVAHADTGADTDADAGATVAADDGPGLRVLRIGGSSTDQPIVTHHDRTDGQPTAVTKLPTEPREIDDLLIETRNLRSLNEAAPELQGIPRVVNASGPDDPGPCHLTQSYVAGIPLAAVLDLTNYGAWLEQVTVWVGLLGRATSIPTEPLRLTVAGWLDELEETAPDLVERSRPIIDRLDLDLRVTQHLDFGPWNIHGGQDGIGVIDWVTADRHGLPLGDLVHYATHASALVAGGYGYDEFAAVHRDTMDPLAPLGRSVADAMVGYCAAIGIDQDYVPALRLANWIGSVRRRLSTDSGTIYRWLWEWELVAAERGPHAGADQASSK